MATMTRITGFNLERMRAQMTRLVVDEQNLRLINYAKQEIIKIGDMIKTYNSRHNMDRTGNLLNSLCWGVSYQGALVDSGFYREAQLHPNGMAGTTSSFLHEYLQGDVKYLIEVNGRELAQKYIESYGNNGAKGWKVFFAILAPYWGYWEKGFTMKSNFGNKEKHLQFSVMAQFYDEVKRDLKPARVRFRCSVPKYQISRLEKRWKRYSNMGRN